MEKNNLIIVSIVALVAFVAIISMFSTSTNFNLSKEDLAGQASKISKVETNDLQYSRSGILESVISKVPTTKSMKLYYGDKILKTNWRTKTDRIPTLDGHLESWELENAATLDFEDNSGYVYITEITKQHHYVYTKLIRDKIYFAIGLELTGANCDDIIYPGGNGYLRYRSYFDEGNETPYGSGELNEIATNNQDDFKSINIIKDYPYGPVRCDGKFEEDIAGQQVWHGYCEGVYPDQITFDGMVGVQDVPGGCMMVSEMLMPLKGADGLLVDSSDLSITPGHYFGFSYEFLSNAGWYSSTVETYTSSPAWRFFKVYVDSQFINQQLSTK